MFGKQNFNGEYKGVRVNDLATKVGSIFGKKGKAVGQVIDKATQNITIKIEDKDKNK